jgi:hypothetical protein
MLLNCALLDTARKRRTRITSTKLQNSEEKDENPPNNLFSFNGNIDIKNQINYYGEGGKGRRS